jgi:hypothetical protein
MQSAADAAEEHCPSDQSSRQSSIKPVPQKERVPLKHRTLNNPQDVSG